LFVFLNMSDDCVLKLIGNIISDGATFSSTCSPTARDLLLLRLHDLNMTLLNMGVHKQ
jgi:hypothetical protein